MTVIFDPVDRERRATEYRRKWLAGELGPRYVDKQKVDKIVKIVPAERDQS